MTLAERLGWVRRHMPITAAALGGLPNLSGVRLAVSTHLDIKMIPAYEGLLARGAALYLTTCNPTTVRDEVVGYLAERGAQAYAWRNMSLEELRRGVEHALAWGPTHTCEMGADLTVAAHSATVEGIRAGLEATGSGIARVGRLALRYPVFNWDDLPVKEGLHNRYLVGLSTWQTFCERTWLSLHGKHVVVVGFGSVGQGVAEAARAFGGCVSVVERDPARALTARYAGWRTGTLVALAPEADVLVTATGVAKAVDAAVLALLKDGCFLLNVGHVADEIELGALGERTPLIPFVEACHVAGKTLYLFAGGSMANLTAGFGDSLNAFDLTLAIMVAGIGFIVGEGEGYAPGLYPLPLGVWQPLAAAAH